MGLIPCSLCRVRPEEKLCQVTWAWNPRPKERIAFRQRLCVSCFCSTVAANVRDFDIEARLTCVACGIDVEDDMEAVYCTAYIPGTGKIRYEFPFCAPHAVDIRVKAQTNAELLPDREPESRGLAPSTTPGNDPWSRLGIVPRE